MPFDMLRACPVLDTGASGSEPTYFADSAIEYQRQDVVQVLTNVNQHANIVAR